MVCCCIAKQAKARGHIIQIHLTPCHYLYTWKVNIINLSVYIKYLMNMPVNGYFTIPYTFDRYGNF